MTICHVTMNHRAARVSPVLSLNLPSMNFNRQHLPRVAAVRKKSCHSVVYNSKRRRRGPIERQSSKTPVA